MLVHCFQSALLVAATPAKLIQQRRDITPGSSSERITNNDLASLQPHSNLLNPTTAPNTQDDHHDDEELSSSIDLTPVAAHHDYITPSTDLIKMNINQNEICQQYYSANTDHAVCQGNQAIVCRLGCSGGVVAQNCQMNLTGPITTETCNVAFTKTSATAYLCTTSQAAFTCAGPVAGSTSCSGCVPANSPRPDPTGNSNNPPPPENNEHSPANHDPSDGSGITSGAGVIIHGSILFSVISGLVTTTMFIFL